MKNCPASDGVNIEDLVSRTNGFVGADIYSVCQKGAMNAIDRFLEDMDESLEDLMIHQGDMSQAINEVIKMKNTAKFKA
jgi:transitional endoplasmic reticulum ATPase